MGRHMADVKVAVHGATGRVGAEILKAVSADPDLDLVGAISCVSRHT